MPRRIQRKRTKGWKMPAGAVDVTRSGRWGNPFRIGTNRCHGHGMSYRQEPVSDNATAVRFFREMLQETPRNYPSDAEVIAELRGKDLACWCSPDQPCHADVLLELANAEASVLMEQTP